jgi:hypothetical protein
MDEAKGGRSGKNRNRYTINSTTQQSNLCVEEHMDQQSTAQQERTARSSPLP